jgi:hypothetical protein
MATKRDEYALSNANNNRTLRADSNTQKFGQTFLTTANYDLTSIKIDINRQNDPTGNMWLEILATSGGNPTGSPLATSDSVVIDALSQTQYTQEFTFSTPYELADATTYCIASTGNWTLSAVHTIILWEHHIGAYGDGSQFTYNGSSWSGTTNDLPFETWGDDVVSGPANVAKVGGIAKASISKVDGVAIANIAKINSVA